MMPRLTISRKVFFLAFLNLLVLGVGFLIFMRVQFRLDLESFVFSPAQDRILSVGRLLALEIQDTEPSGWDDLLARYARQHNVELHLLDHDGRHLAGPSAPLPNEVLARFTRLTHHRGHDDPLMLLGTTGNPTRHWVGVRVPVPGARDHHAHGALVAASSSLRGSLFFFDPAPWLAVAAAIILLSVLCWLPLVRGLTKSISHMTRATAQIAEGRFDVQLPEDRRDELGQLSSSINRMAAQLAGFVKGQKRFLGDTAHELCSPIARIQVALGILERSADGEQKASVADLHEDVQHMSSLVNELLSFSKAGIQRASVHMQEVVLDDIVKRVLDREAADGVQIRNSMEPGLKVWAEPDLLSRALSNVIRNAVRYAGAAGPIEISSARQNGIAVLTVSDCGPGLSDDELDAVFEPFYRPEAARERQTGGVGLGLAIVRSCIESCQGTVRCSNRTPSGLEVEIRLQLGQGPGA